MYLKTLKMHQRSLKPFLDFYQEHCASVTNLESRDRLSAMMEIKHSLFKETDELMFQFSIDLPNTL